VFRNKKRFPADFMFQLNKEEYSSLRFQNGTLKKGGHSKYLPYVFTEQGVAMLSGVLKSDRAIKVNIAIMRAFVKIRQVLSTHKQVSRKLMELEARVDKSDTKIQAIFEAIQKMIMYENKPKRKMGFNPDGKIE
jgi:ORF6N domain-containing protein